MLPGMGGKMVIPKTFGKAGFNEYLDDETPRREPKSPLVIS